VAPRIAPIAPREAVSTATRAGTLPSFRGGKARSATLSAEKVRPAIAAWKRPMPPMKPPSSL
jgi:hypothetical protein